MEKKTPDPATPITEQSVLPFHDKDLQDRSSRPLLNRDIVPHYASRHGEIEASDRLLQAEVDRLSAQRTRLTELGRMSASLREKIKQREEYLQKLKEHREHLKAEHITLRAELEQVHQQTLAARAEVRAQAIQNAAIPRQGMRLLRWFLLAGLLGACILAYEYWRKRSVAVVTAAPTIQAVSSASKANRSVVPMAGLYDLAEGSDHEILRLRLSDEVTDSFVSYPSQISADRPR